MQMRGKLLFCLLLFSPLLVLLLPVLAHVGSDFLLHLRQGWRCQGPSPFMVNLNKP